MDFDCFKRRAERRGKAYFLTYIFQSIRRVLMVKFRFQDLDIWEKAITIADDLFDIADELEQKKLFRLAEQLRGSGLSMSNNIAEGSASNSQKVFRRYLNIARNSTFENANVIIMLERRSLIETEEKEALLNDLDHLCRMITNFKKSL